MSSRVCHPSITHCRSWNRGRCISSSSSCRIADVCSGCGADHNASICPGRTEKEVKTDPNHRASSQLPEGHSRRKVPPYMTVFYFLPLPFLYFASIALCTPLLFFSYLLRAVLCFNCFNGDLFYMVCLWSLRLPRFMLTNLHWSLKTTLTNLRCPLYLRV